MVIGLACGVKSGYGGVIVPTGYESGFALLFSQKEHYVFLVEYPEFELERKSCRKAHWYRVFSIIWSRILHRLYSRTSTTIEQSLDPYETLEHRPDLMRNSQWAFWTTFGKPSLDRLLYFQEQETRRTNFSWSIVPRYSLYHYDRTGIGIVDCPRTSEDEG